MRKKERILLTKDAVVKKLRYAKIAVIRGDNPETARAICETAVKSGIDALEITFTLKQAPELIALLKKELPETLVGAGTVLNRGQAESALQSGADFLVSPCVVEEVGRFCRERGAACVLGAMTATEALRAHECGSDLIKLFPGEALPLGFIKALKAPMPFLDFIPTGGVNDANIRGWFEAGAYAVGLGGYLTKGVDLAHLDVLEQRCRALAAACGGLK